MLEAIKLVVGRLEVAVRNHHDFDLESRLKLGDFGTLLIQQVGRHVNRNLRPDCSAVVLHGLFLNDAQYMQGRRLGVANDSSTVAARAGDVRAFVQGRA
jgi:hypothetical protein